MKNKSYVITTLFTLFCGILLLTHCQKEEKLVETEPTNSYLSITTDAKEFIDFFESNHTTFSGIFAKISEGNILFQKVTVEDESFIGHDLEAQPVLSPVLITGSGDIKDIEKEALTPEQLSTLEGDFDFAYFNWKDLKVIAANSEKLYFSVTKINFGPSIHSSTPENIDRFYSSIKLEGDFKKVVTHRDDETTPMYLIGPPCPPDWK